MLIFSEVTFALILTSKQKKKNILLISMITVHYIAEKMICERLRMQHCSKKTVINLVVVGIEAGSGNPDRSFSAGKKQLKLSKYLRGLATEKNFR